MFLVRCIAMSLAAIVIISCQSDKSHNMYEDTPYTVTAEGDTLTKRIEFGNLPDGSYAITVERNGIQKTVNTTIDCDASDFSKTSIKDK